MEPIDENLFIIQCKLLATTILDIILDFEIDVRVSEMTKLFKDLN